jgi:hypothetical protein
MFALNIKNMKRTFLLLAFIAFGSCVNAQSLHKGSWLLGGGFGLERSEVGWNNNFPGQPLPVTTGIQLAVQPQLAYFVGDNFAIGTRFLWALERERVDYTNLPAGSQRRFYSLGAGAFVKFFRPMGNRFFLNLEIGGSYQQVPNSTYQDETATAVALYVNPGISYFLNDKWALQAQFASLYFTESDHNLSNLLPEHGSRQGILFGPAALNLRLMYFLGKNQ